MTTSLDQSPIEQTRDSNGSLTSAVVIGGSIAGLLAARVLTHHFDRVTLVERDRLPSEPAPRPGVPQSLHVHALLTQGARILESLFPGITDELGAAGAPLVEWTSDWLFYAASGWSQRCHSDLASRACSRVLLESTIRQRLRAFDTLTLLEGYQVTGLCIDKAAARVTGIRLKGGDRPFQDPSQGPSQDAAIESLAADLVVDASGRNSPLPDWLQADGFPTPAETRVNSFLGYASRWYRPPTSFQPSDWKGITVAANPGDNPRGGVLYPVEGDECSSQRWIVTLAGIGGDYPPTDDEGFLTYTRHLRDPILYDLLKDAEPISPIYSYRRTENRLRHYDALPSMPDGVVAIGDAVCAFNPVYGQGMTTAALGATVLDRCIAERMATRRHRENRSMAETLRGLPLPFQKRLAKIVSNPWLMATGEDFRWESTVGGQPPWTSRLTQRYIDQIIALTAHDSETYRAFAQVMHLVEPPTILFHPRLAMKVCAYALRQKFQGKSEAPGAARHELPTQAGVKQS